jgi:hypothetical protein
MTKRWPDYWDLCLECRYAKLDHVAEFIHDMMDRLAESQLRINDLEWSLMEITKAQYNADSKDIANKALETKPTSFKTKVKLKVVK